MTFLEMEQDYLGEYVFCKLEWPFLYSRFSSMGLASASLAHRSASV